MSVVWHATRFLVIIKGMLVMKKLLLKVLIAVCITGLVVTLIAVFGFEREVGKAGNSIVRFDYTGVRYTRLIEVELDDGREVEAIVEENVYLTDGIVYHGSIMPGEMVIVRSARWSEYWYLIRKSS